MYRLPEADDAVARNRPRSEFASCAEQFQQEIDENPSDPHRLQPMGLADQQHRGRFSEGDSLLAPLARAQHARRIGAASFLDTLGRCYFAAGDFENAVKYERQAIAKVDYMQVMQRQLALFEKALAEKEGGASKQPAKSN